jgi:hypothetical protein
MTGEIMNMFHNYNLARIEDKANPFSALFETEDGGRFYVEPAFYSQLLAIEEREPRQLGYIIDEMLRLVKKNRHIVFTLDYMHPITRGIEDFIYLEIRDVVGNLKLYFVNSSNVFGKGV